MTFGRPSQPPSPAAMAPALGGDLIKDTTTASFTRDVLEGSKAALIVVHFWSPRSQACKQLAPVLEKVVRSYGGKVHLVRMDIDAHPAIAGQLRIQSLPTVYAFRDGRPLDGFAGPQPEAAIKEFIDRAVGEDAGADLQAALDGAEAALEAGDLQGAAEVFGAVLQEEPQHPVALAGLARCYLKSDDLERAEQTLELVAPDKRSMTAVASVQASIDLAKQAANAGDMVPLEAAIAADPKNHQARIDLAIALAARDRKEDAATQLLESIRQDRKWNDEAARKQLVKFFEAWGAKDPATLDGRRRLSGVLFS
jgi:putative thioredoxin